MPHIDLSAPYLLVDLPDFSQGKTILKRQAQFKRQLYQPDMIQIIWLENLYIKNQDGGYGDLLTSTEKILNATGIDFVNIETGIKICAVAEEYIEDELNPLLKDVGYETDLKYYQYVARTQAVIIDNVVSGLINNYYTSAP